jgi:hypothetical protein
MQKSQSKKRFLSIRLTEGELKEIYRQCEKSSCRSLTEYTKKVLTKKPVIGKNRNESHDNLLQAMIAIKNRLDDLILKIPPSCARPPDHTPARP